jgi:hypothetical protein
MTSAMAWPGRRGAIHASGEGSTVAMVIPVAPGAVTSSAPRI